MKAIITLTYAGVRNESPFKREKIVVDDFAVMSDRIAIIKENEIVHAKFKDLEKWSIESL